MITWVVWLVLAALLVVAEVLSLTLVLGMAAVGALAAAGLAWLGVGLVGQLTTFTLVTVATLAFVRPIAKRHLRTTSSQRTGVAALVGQSATVVSTVNADAGQIKLAGEIWSARAWDGDEVIEPGARVEVVKIEGATALVLKGV